MSKAGPVVTDSGNFILDVDCSSAWGSDGTSTDKTGDDADGKDNTMDMKTYNGQICDLNTLILGIPGVVETGLFINNNKHVLGENDNKHIKHHGINVIKAYFGQLDGTVTTREAPTAKV